MALPKLFQRIFWHNNTTPAINEDNLNAISKAIDDIDDRVIQIGSAAMEAGALVKDAEAWAVGTRGGVPVPSTDETYHNNSKWYAQHPDFDLSDIRDVEITAPTEGDAIVWDSSLQKWVNGPADVGLVKNGILCCRYQTD